MASKSQDLGGPLKASIDRRDTATHIALAGVINEATDLTPLTKIPGALHIDLAGVNRINSIGVKAWTTFVRDCERAGTQLTCERCSPVIVQQISMISNFMGTRTRISSVYVVYACPSCHAERLELVELTPGVPASVATSLPCPACSTPMPLDDIEENYAKLFETR